MFHFCDHRIPSEYHRIAGWYHGDTYSSLRCLRLAWTWCLTWYVRYIAILDVQHMKRRLEIGPQLWLAALWDGSSKSDLISTEHLLDRWLSSSQNDLIGRKCCGPWGPRHGCCRWRRPLAEPLMLRGTLPRRSRDTQHISQLIWRQIPFDV